MFKSKRYYYYFIELLNTHNTKVAGSHDLNRSHVFQQLRSKTAKNHFCTTDTYRVTIICIIKFQHFLGTKNALLYF